MDGICSDKEYLDALVLLKSEKESIDKHREALVSQGYNESEIKNLIDPLQSFYLQLEDDIAIYEQQNKDDKGE